jgi:hypothetical protein
MSRLDPPKVRFENYANQDPVFEPQCNGRWVLIELASRQLQGARDGPAALTSVAALSRDRPKSYRQ